MYKYFSIIFCAFSIIFNQNVLSEMVYYNRSYTLNLFEDALEEATLQINSDHTVVVNSTNNDNIMVVLYEGKLKVYFAKPSVEDLREEQEFFNDFKKSDIPQLYTDLNDPIFHTPAIKLNECHYFNTKDCLISGEKSIGIQDSLIESPHILLKSGYIDTGFFLVGTKNIELHNNKSSALCSINFTLNDKTDFEFQPLIVGRADFDYNYVDLMCTHATKVELQFLPGSFYVKENTIYFN